MEDIEKRLFLQPLANVVTKLCYYRRLERVWQLIEREYADPELTLEKAAKVSTVNKNHLNTLFRRLTALTFHQFLVRYRILKAITIMRSRNYSFLEIALLSGFGSLNTFERNFRSLLGTTPREFKNNLDF